MELYELNNLLHKSKNTGLFLEFKNEKDVAIVSYISTTNSFVFVFNGEPIFSYKTVRHFRDKLDDWINKKNLTLISNN